MNSNIIRRFQHIPTMSWTSRYRNRWLIGSIQPRKGRPPIDARHFRWGCQTGCNLPSAPKGRGCLVWSNYFLRMENYGKLNPKNIPKSYPLLLYILFQDAQLPILMACCAASVFCYVLIACSSLQAPQEKLNPVTKICRCQWFMTTYGSLWRWALFFALK